MFVRNFCLLICAAAFCIHRKCKNFSADNFQKKISFAIVSAPAKQINDDIKDKILFNAEFYVSVNKKMILFYCDSHFNMKKRLKKINIKINE